MNSVQNGITLRADMHTLFDHYAFSINPDVSPPLRRMSKSNVI